MNQAKTLDSIKENPWLRPSKNDVICNWLPPWIEDIPACQVHAIVYKNMTLQVALTQCLTQGLAVLELNQF